MSIRIERGVQMPEHGGRRFRYPFAEMKVDDTFLVYAKPRDLERKQMNVSSAGCLYARRHGGKFKTRQVQGGIRVWRVA